MGGLTLDFRLTLPVVTHDQGYLRKNKLFCGYVLLFGLLIWGPGEGWVWGWGGCLGGLTLDFRLTLPVVTHD